MKKLHLIRHGKSSWKEIELNDIDRPLKKRGIKNSKEIATSLVQSNTKPEVVFTSPAVRAFETAKIISETLELSNDQLVVNDKLYMPDFPNFLKCILYLDDQFSEVLMVGHEPSLSAIINHFTKSTIDKVITASLTTLEFQAENWKDISAGNLTTAYHTNRHDYKGFELT